MVSCGTERGSEDSGTIDESLSALGATGGPISRFRSRFIGIVALAGQTSFGRCPGQAPLT